MHSFVRASTSILVALAVAFLLAGTARAQDASTPCGKFDFSGGLSCKIEVSGGCTANCSPLNFEAACTGGCTATTTTSNCTDNCGTTCVAMCNPQLLDCFAGCHSECDQPTVDQCRQSHPTDDCATTARAQCDIHCKDSCAVPPSNCQEHCTKCCRGSCDTQTNFECDFSCFARVQGGCDVQCQRPEGAIFCNGQYVYASDVQACSAYLATQGLQVDVSARASGQCDLNGCHGIGDASVSGCSAAGALNQTAAVGPFAVGLLLAMTAAARWRRRQATAPARRR
jgi:hypothetical protein